MSAAQQCWSSVATQFEGICLHPFVLGLADGTLPEEVFVRYLVDDAHYLDRYARVLAQLAVRAPTTAGVELLAGFAVGSIAAERGLHRDFLAPLGLDPDVDVVPDASSTCAQYTDFLMTTATSEPFDVGLAAVLPCFRVYSEVGQRILGLRTPGEHPYAAWIDSYAAPEFTEAVRRAEAYLDEVVVDAAAAQAAYARSTRFEWMFWDTAWRSPTRPSPHHP